MDFFFGCRKWYSVKFWSEIGSGFGEPGGTPLPRIPRSTPRVTAPICLFPCQWHNGVSSLNSCSIINNLFQLLPALSNVHCPQYCKINRILNFQFFCSIFMWKILNDLWWRTRISDTELANGIDYFILRHLHRMYLIRSGHFKVLAVVCSIKKQKKTLSASFQFTGLILGCDIAKLPQIKIY